MIESVLSKSTFLRGLQCEKNLYLHKHHYNLKDEASARLQAIFNQGNQVGVLAQDLLPNGVDASHSNHFKIQESVLKTKQIIEQRDTIIYEATFQYNGVIAAIDILAKDDEGWKAFEVKSSTSVSDVHINDAAIQYYTIVNSGIDLKDISIVHINSQYVKHGEIDVQKLFTIHSVYDRVQEVLPNIPNQIERFKQVISQDEVPGIDIGPHCSNPYDCDFKGHCWNHIPDYSIFNISRLQSNKKFELYDKGIVSLKDLDLKNSSFNESQLLQVTSALNNEIHVNKKHIVGFLDDLEYPLYFLDFETMGTAIPIYDNCRPYQQVVFQYSLHIQDKNGKLEHKEFLAQANPNIDHRETFIKKLMKDIGNSGDILVYNIGFERGKLNELISLYPQYKEELNQLKGRLVDLMIPFQKKWYYTPEMKGSYSIKAVLPALVPKLSYEDLEISEGGSASAIFTQMVLDPNFDEDIEATRKNLLDYCELDTLAMVKIYEVLKEIV